MSQKSLFSQTKQNSQSVPVSKAIESVYASSSVYSASNEPRAIDRNKHYARAKNQDNNIKKQGLQFKSTKKRTLKRPSRSKSSVSAIVTQHDKNKNNIFIINSGINQQNQAPPQNNYFTELQNKQSNQQFKPFCKNGFNLRKKSIQIKDISNIKVQVDCNYEDDKQKYLLNHHKRGVRRTNQQSCNFNFVPNCRAIQNFNPSSSTERPYGSHTLSNFSSPYSSSIQKQFQQESKQNMNNFWQKNGSLTERYRLKNIKNNRLVTKYRQNSQYTAKDSQKYESVTNQKKSQYSANEKFSFFEHPPFNQTCPSEQLVGKWVQYKGKAQVNCISDRNPIFFNTYSEQNSNGTNLYSHMRNRSQNICPSFQNCSPYQSQQQPSQYQYLNKKFSKNKQSSLNKKQLWNCQKKLTIQDFQLGLPICQDIFGKNFPARHIKTNFLLCIKQIKKRQIKTQLQKLINYLKIHSSCKTPFITSVYGLINSQTSIYILYEYYNEGQISYRTKRTHFKHSPISHPASGLNIKNNLMQNIFSAYCVVSAIKQLHERDIILQNLMVENVSEIHNVCKLHNLIWSTYAKSDGKKQNNQVNPRHLNIVEYCAPEQLNSQNSSHNENISGKQCDIWAIGIFLYELISGNTPYCNLSHKATVKKILHETIICQNFMNFDQVDHSQSQINKTVLLRVKNLMIKILNKNPKQRPTAHQLLKQIEEIMRLQQQQ